MLLAAQNRQGIIEGLFIATSRVVGAWIDDSPVKYRAFGVLNV